MQNSMMTARRQSSEEIIDPLLALLAQDHGNVYEQIDPYTLEIISKLFPSSGIEFLSRVLQHATIIQNVHPKLEALGERVAVINTRTIRLLSQAIHWGYDTTHKYVSVFMSLDLLYRHKHTTGNMLVFPLKAYEIPRSLNALDKLINQSRPKVQQFARKVKERLSLYNLISSVEQESKGMSGPSERDLDVHQFLLSSMVNVIKSEGIESDKGTHIALRLITEVISKIMSPRHSIQFQVPKRLESSIIGPNYIPEPSLATKSNTIVRNTQHQQPIQTQKRNDVTKVSDNLKNGRLIQNEVSYTTAEKSTQKEDFMQESSSPTAKGRLAQEKEAYIIEKKSTQKEDFSLESTTTTTETKFAQSQSLPSAQSLPQKQEDSYSTPQKVSSEHENEETHDLINFPTKEVYDINDVLDFYYGLLKSAEVDWNEIALPVSFFEEIYDNLSAHYRRSDASNLLPRMKKYMWVSIENNIIRKAARHLGVNEENACSYTSWISGRHYEQDKELHRNLYAPTAALTQSPTKANTTKTKETESPSYEDSSLIESPSKPVAGKTFKKTQIESTEKESPYPQQKEDSQTSKSSQIEDSYDNEIDRPETFLEAKRRQQHEEFMALCEPEIKPLRIPAEVDSDDYLEAFYYVLRNRNINILFNLIYKNDTIRTNAAKFLTHVFDHDDKNVTVNKLNEKLLKKYEPEIIISAFIDTIISLHEPGNESLQNPGAFFTSRCKFYVHNQPDVETDELIKRFSDMSYHSFAGEMHTLINSGQKIRTKHYKKRS